jgi:ABC-type polysaccharide/polyol phosphate transport system ATPase subunit
MTLRLSFAVAAHLNCDLLLIDEVLAVGDPSFADKCLMRMQHLRDQGMTIVLTSHNLRTVASFCSRALLFRGGCLVADGQPAEIVGLCENSTSRSEAIDPRHGWRARGVGAAG